RLYDPVENEVVGELREGLGRNSGFGSRILTCDLNNDNVDEIIVAAPGAELQRNGYIYRQVGAVYVYETTNLSRLSKFTSAPPVGDPAAGYWCYGEYDPATQQQRQVCGEQ